MKRLVLRPEALAGLAALSLSACTQPDHSHVFQRMEIQDDKFLPYTENDLFQDGRAMRPLMEGTVPRERLATLAIPHEGGGPSAGQPGTGNYLTKIPVEVTPELMARGHKRFDITCATCHGIVGDGDSMVAANMSLRPPPSLMNYVNRPPGYIFDVITHGHGLMASYANEIPVMDRWGVVAYVQALQRSQTASLDQVPADERGKLTGGTP